MKKYTVNRICFDAILFLLGGLTYGFIEILWRRRTHISMVITGGLCFLILYKIFTKFKDMLLLYKCVIGSAVITTLEFFCGCIVNLLLKLNVWDYSKLPFNLLGQICILYSVLWGLLTIPISLISYRISKLTHFSGSKQKQNVSVRS